MTVDSTPNENPADHDRTARRWRNGMDHAGGRWSRSAARRSCRSSTFTSCRSRCRRSTAGSVAASPTCNGCRSRARSVASVAARCGHGCEHDPHRRNPAARNGCSRSPDRIGREPCSGPATSISGVMLTSLQRAEARRFSYGSRRVTVVSLSIERSNDRTSPTPVASACATRYASAKSRRSIS